MEGVSGVYALPEIEQKSGISPQRAQSATKKKNEGRT